MKIGIDIRNIGKKRTGDEVVFFNLVKNLALIDSENEYLLLTDITDSEILKNVSERLGIDEKKNFRIISFHCPNKFVWNLWTLPDYLRKNPVDVYHTQYITPFFVPKNVKIVTHIHDVSFNAYPEFISKKDIFFLKTLIPRSLERADLIVSVSEFTKQEIVRYYGTDPEKIEVIYNAVDEEMLRNDYSGNELFDIRKKYNLPEKYILYMGTLQPRKNIAFLVKSFAAIKNRIPDLKLVLAGNRSGHNFDQRIDEEIKKLSIDSEVIFPGFVDEDHKNALFQMAEVFVFPSLYEGFGIPILEAMSQKIPVLASNITVHAEVAGEGALFFDPMNLEDLSVKLYNAIDDKNLREKLINSGNSRFNFFSWKKSADKLLDVYKKLQ